MPGRRWLSVAYERFDSLKARMALLMGLVLVAPASYAIVKSIQAYLDQSASMEAALQRNSRMIATADAVQLERLRTSLERIGTESRVNLTGWRACADQVTRSLTGVADFAWVAILDRNGHLVCGSRALGTGRDFRAAPFLSALAQGTKFIVGRLEEDQLTGAGSVIRLATSLPGGIGGAVLAAIPDDRFDAVPPSADLPDGALVALLDAGGQVIAATTSAAPSAQQGDVTAALLREPGTPMLVEAAGEPRRLFVAEPVLGGRMYVMVGLPSPRWSWLERDLMIGIFAPALMLSLAVLAIWTVTDLLINRHIRALAVTTRAYGRGRLNTPLSLKHAPTELRELGATLERMAERVQRREAELKASLEQKDALLREIHHRVKNNLQIVSSLLNLRARSLVAPAAREVMLEAQLRVKALALVHRHLYQHEDVTAIELGKFLVELGGMLCELGRDRDGTIDLSIDAPSVTIATDRAIPLALLVTEAVSNAFRHAFPDGRDGQIKVTLEVEDGAGLLCIKDDGIGLSAGRAAAQPSQTLGIGMTLIELLAKQMGGKLCVEERDGTEFRVDFPLLTPAPSASLSLKNWSMP